MQPKMQLTHRDGGRSAARPGREARSVGMLSTSGFRHDIKTQGAAVIQVFGYDWCGSIVHYGLIPLSMLKHEHANTMWDECRKICSWYEIVGGSRSMQKLKNRSDSLSRKINQLLLEPQSSSIQDQIKALREDMQIITNHLRFLQVMNE